MPEIYPFRAVHYSEAKPLDRCLAPPYDVISPKQREDYAARDAHNVVHLILPKEQPGDDAQHNKYLRAGAAYRDWQRDGVLGRDAEPSLYVLHQAFEWEGKRHVRRGLLTRMRLRPFSDGVILPHERTLSGPKADRLQIFRAAKANLSPIFALYPSAPNEDPVHGDGVADLLERAVAGRKPDLSAKGDDGVDNLLWRVSDPAVIAEVVKTLAPRKAFIADGHHRYETGLAYAKELDDAGAPASGAHHSILAYLCGMGDPGLLILPTHRLLHSLPGFEAHAFLKRAEEFFAVTEVAEPDANTLKPKLREVGQKHPSFAFVANGKAWLLSLRQAALHAIEGMPRRAELASLDVTVLHSLLFQRLIGLSPKSQELQENLRYYKDAAEAIAAVREGAGQAAFLMNSTAMGQVRAVAEAGEVMPQKSTFFFPKLPSGLLFNPLDPEEKLG